MHFLFSFLRIVKFCRTIEVSLWYLPAAYMRNRWSVLYIGGGTKKWANLFVQVTFIRLENQIYKHIYICLFIYFFVYLRTTTKITYKNRLNKIQIVHFFTLRFKHFLYSMYFFLNIWLPRSHFSIKHLNQIEPKMLTGP